MQTGIGQNVCSVVGLPQAKRLRVQARGEGGGVSGDPNFFLQISSSWVKLRLPSKNTFLGSLVGLLQAKRLRVQAGGKGGGGGHMTPIFVLHISSSWVKLRLPSENHLPGLPGSA